VLLATHNSAVRFLVYRKRGGQHVKLELGAYCIMLSNDSLSWLPSVTLVPRQVVCWLGLPQLLDDACMGARAVVDGDGGAR